MCVQIVFKNSGDDSILLATDNAGFTLDLEKYSRVGQSKPISEHSLEDMKDYILGMEDVGPKIEVLSNNCVFSYIGDLIQFSPLGKVTKTYNKITELLEELNITKDSSIGEFARIQRCTLFLVKDMKVYAIDEGKIIPLFTGIIAKNPFYVCGHFAFAQSLRLMVFDVVNTIGLDDPVSLKESLDCILSQLSKKYGILGSKTHLLKINKDEVKWI
jgi:hypothetical protein